MPFDQGTVRAYSITPRAMHGAGMFNSIFKTAVLYHASGDTKFMDTNIS